MGVDRLKNYIKGKGMEVQFHEFPEPTLSVEKSAKELGVSPKRIVKSLILVDEETRPLMAIITGDRRVDEERLSDVHGLKVRMAKAREVEKFSGYKIGEVPPIGLGLRTYVDPKVMDFGTVIAGGGSTHTLIEINTIDIVEANEAIIADICESA